MEGHSPQSEQGGNWRWIPFQCDDACPTPKLIAELVDPNNITSSITKRGISPLVNPFLDVRSLLLQDEAVELETPKQHHVKIASEEKVLAMRSTQEEKCV